MPKAKEVHSPSAALDNTITHPYEQTATLNMLTPSKTSWKLKLKVKAKSKIRTIKPTQPTNMFQATFMDSNGHHIRAVFFDEAAEHFHPVRFSNIFPKIGST
eukprot:gb/GECG01000790.1/.p1 GENE.gb/GECG01000790.1/~~gb/GECG01000790.1/.p1  ORF type:complete len:102 (+),score=5.54 gb/GECG01000790.1/:1-306(+)